MSKIDVAALKQQAAGRWPAVLSALGGVPADALDGKNHPCPKCGGKDRFRFTNLNANGSCFCNQCAKGIGDGIAALQWLRGGTFPETVNALAEYLGQSSDQPSRPAHNGKPKIVATYDYRDEQGILLYQVVRFDPKDFRQRRPKDGGGWTWSVKGVRMVPYRLPDLLTAGPERGVLVLEGEKDVDRAAGMGIIATTNAMGAGKWRPEYNEHFRGRSVYIIPDNDQPGRKHAQQVAMSLHGIAKNIKVVELPGVPEKGDLCDWLDQGGTKDKLAELVKAAPDWKPSPDDKQKTETRIGSPVVVKLADVTPEPITWLWPGRVASGKLTLLAGDPGLGKSLVSLDIAARVSTGNCWPDCAARPARGGVVLLSAEDDPADTIRPRLDAAGADVSRVNLIQAVEWFDGDAGQRVTRSFSLERDAAALEEAIDQTPDCRLVIIDPISAYLGGTDSHKNADIRGLLTPLSQLAQRRRVAVLAVTHLNKSAGPAMYRSMGSLAFVAAARAVWAVVKDQEDSSKRLMLPIKNNLAADTSGLSYQVVVPNGVPCLAWSDQPVTITVDDALAAGRNDDPRDSDRREAKAWLRNTLSGGPVPVKEIEHQAREEGLSWATIRRAKSDLGIKIIREGFGRGSVSKWAMPSDPPDHTCSPNAIDAHLKDVSKYGESEQVWDEGTDQSKPVDPAVCAHQDVEETPTFDGYLNRQCRQCGERLPCRRVEAKPGGALLKPSGPVDKMTEPSEACNSARPLTTTQT
jgi:archaellum biogenesis ATPase FlaH